VQTHAEAWRAATAAAQPCARAWLVACTLQELLANAIEHGNLGIGAQTKQQLLASGEWAAELQRRQASAAQQGRRVALRRWREADGWCFEICDEGDGFAWQALEAVAPLQAALNSTGRGRGLQLVQQLLPGAELRFHGCGNRVCLRVPD
jgi:anti-sigma regulatory factor (Ser/Thr protein kinase)